MTSGAKRLLSNGNKPCKKGSEEPRPPFESSVMLYREYHPEDLSSATERSSFPFLRMIVRPLAAAFARQLVRVARFGLWAPCSHFLPVVALVSGPNAFRNAEAAGGGATFCVVSMSCVVTAGP